MGGMGTEALLAAITVGAKEGTAAVSGRREFREIRRGSERAQAKAEAELLAQKDERRAQRASIGMRFLALRNRPSGRLRLGTVLTSPLGIPGGGGGGVKTLLGQ